MRFPLLAMPAVLTLLVTASAAHAASDDLIVDDAGIISDVGKVTAAARKLGNDGADVRVRTVKSLGNAPNLDEYEIAMQQQCPSWQSGGYRKSTLLVVMYAPSTLDAGIYYGVQLKSKLDPVWVSIRNNALQPAISAYRNNEKDAYTKAFVSMLGNFGDVLKTPLTGGPTTIIRHEATDTSWIGTVLITLAFICTIVIAIVFFMRRREDNSEVQGVAAETYRIRADCRNRLLALNEQIMVLEARWKGRRPVRACATRGHVEDLQELRCQRSQRVPAL